MPTNLPTGNEGVLTDVFIPTDGDFQGTQGSEAVGDLQQSDLDDIEARINAAITADPLCLAIAEFVYESIIADGSIGDVLDLGDGDDTLNARNGNDIVFGGTGNDSIAGGNGIDLLLGEDGNDVLSGGGDDDGLFGGAGNDELNGGDGIDYLCGGTGFDMLDGGAGADFMAGGAGSDIYHVDDVGDFIFEGATEGDHDGIIWEIEDDLDLSVYENVEHAKIAGLGNHGIDGTSANNILLGNDGKNVLAGLGGSDSLAGEGGNDFLSGGDGIDVLRGGAGADSLSGGANIDFADYTDSVGGVDVDLNIAGGQSGGYALGDTLEDIEHVIGSLYNDTLTGDDGNNSLFGDPTTTPEGVVGPEDVLDGDDLLLGKGGNDIMFGRFGSDTMDGGDGDDSILGGEGNDYIRGGAGADALRGGEGNDMLSYFESSGAVGVSLMTGITVAGDAEGDSIAGFENLEGSSFGDFLDGDDGDNVILGRKGNDTLFGNGGEDSLNGGLGNDEIHGGDGADLLSGGGGADEFHGGDDGSNDVMDVGEPLVALPLIEILPPPPSTDTVVASATFAENGTDTINGYDDEEPNMDIIDMSAAIDFDDSVETSEAVELRELIYFVNSDEENGGFLNDTGGDGAEGDLANDNTWFDVNEGLLGGAADTVKVEVDGQLFVWDTDEWLELV